MPPHASKLRTPQPHRGRNVLLALVATLLLAGCQTPTAGLSRAGALAAFQPIRASAQDTCETLKQVAEHNSAYDTLKTGREVVYKATCAEGAKS